MDGGANISQGPGQGEAAIVQPWRNPITPQLEMAAYQQEQARKLAKEKQDQENAKIPGLDFKGLANHAPEFITGYDKIQNELQVDIKNGDRMAQQKALNKLGVLNTLINANIDLKNKIGDLATTLKTNSDKTIFPDAEKAITEATSDLQPDLLDNPAAYAKEITRRIGLVDQGLKGIARFNPQVEAIKLGAEGKAIAGRFADMGYEKFELPEAEDWVTKNVLIDPSVEYHYKDKLESNPDLKKQYGDDWGLLAKTELAPNMLVDITPKPSKGITINNNLPDPNAKPFEGTSVPSEQVFKIGRGFGTVNNDKTSPNFGKIEGYGMATESVPVRVTTLPVAKELGVSTWPEGTIQVDADGGITTLTGGVPDGIKFGQVAGDTYVATQTVEKTVDGQKFVIYKGEVVDPAKIAAFKKDTGIDIPYEQQPIGIFKTGDGGYIYTKAASFLEPASLSNYTVKGQSAAGSKVDEGFNKVMKDKASAVDGSTKTPASTPKAADLDFNVVKTSKDSKIDQFFDYNGKNYRYERSTGKLYENENLIKTIKETGYITPVIGDYYVESTLGNVGRKKQAVKPTSGVANKGGKKL